MAGGVAADATPAASASASSGTWAGCTTRSSTCAQEPVHRRWHHDKMTFGLMYAFTENFVLPLSHDEVVHGKGSLLGADPGDAWQQFATLRAYYAFMWALSGQEAAVHGAGIRAGPRVEFRRRASTGRCSTSAGIAACRRSCATATAPTAAHRALHERDCERDGLPLDRGRRRAPARSSPGCASAATARAPVAVDRQLHAGAARRATGSACRCRAAGARSSTPTPRSTAARTAATRAASTRDAGECHGFPCSRRRHAAAARHALAGARGRRMIASPCPRQQDAPEGTPWTR